MYFQYGFETYILSVWLEPVLSHTEKSWITLNYKQFSMNIKIEIIKLIPKASVNKTAFIVDVH